MMNTLKSASSRVRIGFEASEGRHRAMSRALSLLLLGLSGLPAAAEHGGLKGFNERTAKWFKVAKTPVLNESLKLRWKEDDSALFFHLETAEGEKLVRVDPANGASEELDEEPELPPALKEEKKKERRKREERKGQRRSPDGRWEVITKDGALILRDLSSDTASERTLAESGEDGIFRDAPVWAPDSSRLAIWRTKDVEERIVHYVESSPEDQIQPKYFTNRYPKPGDEIDTRAPWVFFLDDREPIEPDLSLIENPFACYKLEWREDSERLTYEFIERGFGKHHVIEVDSESGGQRTLVREDSDTFIHVYGNSFRHDLNDGEEILWMSQRDGWKHLYLLDGKDGSVKRQVTKGEWVVRDVVKVDEEKREVLLKVSGCYPEQDPYFIHFVRVGIDDGKLIPLTQSPGTHDRLQRSPGGEYYTCRWSRVDHAPVTELRRWEDGELVKTLAEADDSNLRAGGWTLPEPFVTKDRDGKHDIYGIVIRPPGFDPEKKYPVIEKIYAGPHSSFVPKAWKPWMAPMHEVAVHGFILVQIDGRGTSNRSREFHDYCYKNLKDAGFPDRIAWMKEVAKSVPQMDLERVGIFGGSAGGQNAMGAVLFHADFYKAAAADCGCHDNRMDKIWWNEQWMDWPMGPEYADNSNRTHVDKLEGALFLTVGEKDTNVDPSSTYQIVDALIKADKDFEFLLMTGHGHGAGEKRYAQRRRLQFFQRHLGGPQS